MPARRMRPARAAPDAEPSEDDFSDNFKTGAKWSAPLGVLVSAIVTVAGQKAGGVGVDPAADMMSGAFNAAGTVAVCAGVGGVLYALVKKFSKR